MPTATRPKTQSKRRSSKASKPKRRTRGLEVIHWIEDHCVFTDGEWIGQPFRLLPWQKRLIVELFEVAPKAWTDVFGRRRNDGRRFRWALWGVPKKNGKTELAAALGLYFLIGDGEPSPLVVCSAGSDDQADLVYGAAKTMCEMSPTLALVTDTFDREIHAHTAIVFNPEAGQYDQAPNPGARLVRVAAVAGTNDGKNIHAVICDELHEWTGEKGRKVWTVLTNGLGARKRPMVLQITTAGYDRKTVCYEQYDLCRKIERGQETDERYHFYWKTVPDDADWRDPTVWAEANPSWGVTVFEDFFDDQLKKKPENDFRRYFLNQWTTQKVAWLPDGGRDWDEAAVPGLEIPRGAVVYLAVDAAYKYDSTAISILQWLGDSRARTAAEIFTPPPGDTEDAILDMSLVEERIRWLREYYQVKALSYDPAYFGRSAQMMSDEGMLIVKFPQSPTRMITASASIYEAIRAHKIEHNGDPILTAHVKAGASKPMPSGWRLVKDTDEPVDGLIATTMNYQTALDLEAEGHSVYEERGIVTI